MRTFNGSQISLSQLTENGQLDARYAQLNPEFDFYKNTNFNVSKTITLFYADDGKDYTGFLPPVENKKVFTIKNLYSNSPGRILHISGYNSGQGFDNEDEILDLSAPQSLTLIGVANSVYTGWANLSASAGIGASI